MNRTVVMCLLTFVFTVPAHAGSREDEAQRLVAQTSTESDAVTEKSKAELEASRIKLAEEIRTRIDEIEAVEAEIDDIVSAHSVLARGCTPAPEMVAKLNKDLAEIVGRTFSLPDVVRELDSRANAYRSDRFLPTAARFSFLGDVPAVPYRYRPDCKRPAPLVPYGDAVLALGTAKEDLKRALGVVDPPAVATKGGESPRGTKPQPW